MTTAQKSPSDIANLPDDAIHAILTDALAKLLKHIDLTDEHMREVMLIIMQGRCPDALMGALLIALREKGESSVRSAPALRPCWSWLTPSVSVMPMPWISSAQGVMAQIYSMSQQPPPLWQQQQA